MQLIGRIVVVITLGGLISGHTIVSAQQDTAQQDTAQQALPATDDNASPASNQSEESFEEVFAEWLALLKELRDLKERFGIVEDVELPEIRREYQEKLEIGRSYLPRLRDAGLRAYVANPPDADTELRRFLIMMAVDNVNTDQYESGLKIAKTMLDHGSKEKVLYDIGGTAAFGANQFQLADQYLAEARSLELLKLGEPYFPAVAVAQENWEQEQQIRTAEAAADDLPRVRLETSKGDIVLELFENEAPDTVGNFISLVEKGFYNELVFHRVLQGFMAQAGCPEGDGTGGPGYTIFCESSKPGFRRHFAGSLSMAKTEAPHTGGSQFFLSFVPTPHLDGQHTVFGRVIEGMDVLAELQKRDPSDSAQLAIAPDKIIKAEVVRKRPESQYLPNKSSEVQSR